MEHLLPKPTEMNFDPGNLAATWKKWKQTMQSYLNAVKSGKTKGQLVKEEEKYSTLSDGTSR